MQTINFQDESEQLNADFCCCMNVYTLQCTMSRTRAIFVEQSLVSLFYVPMMYSIVSIVIFLLIAARKIFLFKVNVNT
jgi:hypothetical protein